MHFDCRSILRSVMALACIHAVSWSAAAADDDKNKWNSDIPRVASEPQTFAKLIGELKDQKMFYGALSTSRAMLSYFADLPSKELAYATIIELIDRGYPFSTRSDFVAGDVEPDPEDTYRQSYLLYKGINNLEKNMTKWADIYFSQIDRENFPKFIFFQASQAYGSGKPAEATELFKKVLSLSTTPDSLALAKKAARSIARIRYELEDFTGALDIYTNFLLRLETISPNDWIETAWVLYRLKRYSEALGILYNLESVVASNTLQLEKYVLRALAYREYCAVMATEQMIATFTKDFGDTIKGVKLGAPLSKFAKLSQLDIPEVREYREIIESIEKLEAESKHIKRLSNELRPLATFLYQAERKSLLRAKGVHEDRALELQARQLVILDESLKFMKFDVSRERFNPDRVFSVKDVEPKLLVEPTLNEKNFLIHWFQWGDFWRDERLLFRALIQDECSA